MGQTLHHTDDFRRARELAKAGYLLDTDTDETGPYGTDGALTRSSNYDGPLSRLNRKSIQRLEQLSSKHLSCTRQAA